MDFPLRNHAADRDDEVTLWGEDCIFWQPGARRQLPWCVKIMVSALSFFCIYSIRSHNPYHANA
jgi:hypothetical protein